MRSNSLESFLEQKPLYYKEIDYDRFPRIYKKIAHLLPLPPIIHLVGTNGKGTTGRFLATALYNEGFHVGHYTSPHIIRFNERIWIDGAEIEDERLDSIHQWFLSVLEQKDIDALSYFEYTTLIAMKAFTHMDYIVLEAGLGGEFDATSAFDTVLTILTPVAMDHEAFLGDCIESIATTKINATKKHLLVAHQKYDEVYEIAKRVANQKGFRVDYVDTLVTTKHKQLLQEIAQQLQLPVYLQENLQTACIALDILGISYTSSSFYNARLFGRLTKLTDTILIDVGHNPLAAESIVAALYPKKYTLIYNSFKDKEYKKILTILKPIIEKVEIIDINDDRIEEKGLIQKTLKDLKIQYRDFTKIKQNQQYLVFGSFSVVEEFLKNFYA